MSTTMHFGPEWMRTTGKHSAATRPHNPHSPPPTNGVGTASGGGTSIPPASGISTQSSNYSLAGDTNINTSASTSSQQFHLNANQNTALTESSEKRDPSNNGSNPPLIRYSKEQLLRIYRETGGKAGVGVDTDKWDALHDSLSTTDVHAGGSEDEKKRFPDSGMRRRQSSDLLTTSLSNGSDRPRLNQIAAAGPGSPMRERFGGLASGRRRESTDQSQTVPRKLSLSSPQNPLGGSRDHGLPSPRGQRTSSSNFDGVLNPGGDSWMARRQALKTNTNPTRGDQAGDQDNLGGTLAGGGVKGGSKGETPPLSAVSASGSQHLSGSIHDMSASVSQMSLQSGGGVPGDLSGGQKNGAGSGLPPGITDFASVQWSYLDPQGNVQGPFRADVMQKWHEDGYFTPDLLMKRLNLDTEWMTVAEIIQRTTNPSKPFLAPIGPPPGPPGLARMSESPHLGYAPPSGPDHISSTPHQPAPLRSLRASTLESYVGNGSNPSDSPASSLGAGRLADPTAFGGRAGNAYFQEQSGYAGQNDSFGRRNAFAEGFRSNSADLVPGASLDNYGFAGRYSNSSNAWPPQHNIIGGFSNDRFGPDPSQSFSPASGLVGNLNGASMPYSQNLSQDPNGGIGRFGDENQQGGSMYQNFDANNMSYNSPSIQSSSFNQYMSAQQQQAYQNPLGTPSKLPQAGNIMSHDSPLLQSQHASPWGHPQQQQQQHSHDSPSLNRAAVYDSPLRSPAIAQVGSWNQLQQQTLPTTGGDNLSWNAESPVKPTQLWPDTNHQTTISNLTISNVGKHNQQEQEQPSASLQEVLQQPVPAELVVESLVVEEEAAPLVVPVEEAPPAASPVTKTRKSSTTQAPATVPSPTATKPTSAAVPTIPKEPTPPPVVAPPSLPAKPAWSTEEEVKKPKTSTSISLRDIQEAEAKKAEARKAAERERERAARAAAAVSAPSPAATEEPFTATWGLSGARGSAVKEPPTAPGAATGTSTPSSAWTAAAKASAPAKKKTMKEIQEEEEKRKAAAAKAAAAASASASAAPARRGYAESTVKSPTPTAVNSAWTTVGAGGKAQASAGTPVRPAPTPTAAASTSTSASVPRANGVPPRQAPSPMVVKTVSNPRPIDDSPVAPSHDFLRWLNDSLKGLNSSVNVEEIMSMLLTFPVEADSSTLEIISDLIYANSTTLDGRRFASDFSTKRKADALSRPKSNGTSGGSGKPVSIADVVKAQPKPTQPEWGGFKVVNKKKKGGRA